MRKRLQVLVLRAGRNGFLRRLFKLYYRLALALAGWVFSAFPEVRAVLLRGSSASGHLVPGLSDLDFELIVLQRSGPESMVHTVSRIHSAASLLYRFFPLLQSPFIRTEEEWRRAREVPHEWLSHSRWVVVRGSFPIPEYRGSKEQTTLALFRLCLRELSKTVPHSLFQAPFEGCEWPVRLNPDRIDALRRLSRVLEVSVPELESIAVLEQRLRERRFVSRQAASVLACYLTLQFRSLQRIAPVFGEGARHCKDFKVDATLPAPDPNLENLANQLRAFLPAAVRVITSSAGARYHQRKLYLVPAPELEDQELQEAVLSVHRFWKEQAPVPHISLSYAAPVLLPAELLPLVQLGFCSIFEDVVLFGQGEVEKAGLFLPECLERELVDGIYLLRKKVGMQATHPRRFSRYLQDYFVGLYPALYLASRHRELYACPQAAARRFVEVSDGGYSRLLRNYLSSGELREASFRVIEADPSRHLQLLESAHSEWFRAP